MRFLILNSPTPSTLPEYLEDLRANGVRDLVRVCQRTYEDKVVEKAGIRVHEWQIPDGHSPERKALGEWLGLVEKAFGMEDRSEGGGCCPLGSGKNKSAGAREASNGLGSAAADRRRALRRGGAYYGGPGRDAGLVEHPQVPRPLCLECMDRTQQAGRETEAGALGDGGCMQCRQGRQTAAHGEPLPELLQCSGCKAQVAAGDPVWRCDASGFNLCKKCKELQRRQRTFQVGAGELKRTAEDTFGVVLDGLTVVTVAYGGLAHSQGVEMGYNITVIGNCQLRDAADLRSALAEAKAPFQAEFEVDYYYLPPCIGVHCIAGLGRAPVLVAIALMELGGVQPEEAIRYIRDRRSGCFNKEQLGWLMSYNKTRKQGCSIQ